MVLAETENTSILGVGLWVGVYLRGTSILVVVLGGSRWEDRVSFCVGLMVVCSSRVGVDSALSSKDAVD